MCLACTQWWECMRLACTQKKGKTFVWRVHTKTEQICVHKKEKKKACVWRVHTQTHVFFLFFWRVHSGGNACVWRVHKKRGKHSFGVYTQKKWKTCVWCVRKKEKKNNNKQIDVYIQKKRKTKQTNKQTKEKKQSIRGVWECIH